MRNSLKNYSRKSKKNKGESCPEGCIAVPSINSLEEMSSGYRRVEVP